MSIWQRLFILLFLAGLIWVLNYFLGLPGLFLGVFITLIYIVINLYKIFTKRIQEKNIDELEDLSSENLEKLLKKYFTEDGFEVKKRRKIFQAQKPNKKINFWFKKHFVNLMEVKSFWQSVYNIEADENWVVSSGNFSKDAKSWAKIREIKLVNGQKLSEMINKYLIKEENEPKRDE